MPAGKLKPGVVAEIPIADVTPDPNQPRQAFEGQALQDLADNIKSRGILQPIVVRLINGDPMIVDGERRWRAAKLAGLETVPCFVRGKDQDSQIDVMFDQFAANDLREDLNPIERAAALERLRADGIGPTEIAERLAQHGIKMSRSAVSNTLRLLNLPENAQQLVAEGRLNESDARSLLPLVGPEITPKIVNATVGKLKNKQTITKREFASALEDSLRVHATPLYSHNPDLPRCTKKCKCYVAVEAMWGGKQAYCLDKKALQKKQAEAEERRKKKQETAAAKKAEEPKPETDPTKVKPVKVTTTDAGVVKTARLDYRKHKSLSVASFDTTACQKCPHKHRASYSGDVDDASDRCFYPPCYDNLQRQANKANRRNYEIRTMLDSQMLPKLLEVAAAQPVANALLTPLLAFHAATNVASYYGGLNRLPSMIGRKGLRDYLENALGDEDNSKVVRTMIEALPIEWRHELALYLSLDPADWWQNTEAFAKLFMKAELKDLAPNYDPPDVPVGEWRDRVVNEVGTPAIVRQVWDESWIESTFEEASDDDGEDSCRICGCTEFDPCLGGCHWVEDPVVSEDLVMSGKLLCSNPNCVAAAQAEADRLNEREAKVA